MHIRKITLLIIALLAFNLSQAQSKIEKLNEYIAPNGITYKIGDKIKLGRGSDTNGKFVYVSVGGWAISADPEENRLGAGNAGLIVTIKKINKNTSKRFNRVFFTVGGGNITNYFLDIDYAIAACEIEDCKTNKEETQTSSDKYDKLQKLKKLLDDGVLSEVEYQAEKKKILNGN